MVSEVAQPMTVLVTGASGFLGSHLAETLVKHGHRVRALVRKTSRTELLEELGAELVYASLETGEGLDEAVRGVDAIVHSAGIVKARTADDFQRVNVGGTVHLLDAAVEVGHRLPLAHRRASREASRATAQCGHCFFFLLRRPSILRSTRPHSALPLPARPVP